MQTADQHFEIWTVQSGTNSRSFEVIRVEKPPDPMELAGAVYTSIRTYFRDSGTPKVLQIQRHITRLRESLAIEHNTLHFDDKVIAQSISHAMQRSSIAGELRIKIVIAPKRSDPILLMIEPLSTPSAADYQQGVRIFTTNYIRKDPKAKVFEFVEIQDRIRGLFGEQVEEVIMLDPSGGMLEGLSSNFFAVLDGRVHTSARGVLNGITRQIVIDCARREGISLVYRKPNIWEIPDFSECFITSTSRGVLPVVAIDHETIGPGIPGPITLRLHHLLEEKILQLVKPL